LSRWAFETVRFKKQGSIKLDIDVDPQSFL